PPALHSFPTRRSSDLFFRRSSGARPPQMPSRMSFSIAYARHSAITGQPLQIRFAAVPLTLGSGKNNSGSTSAHAASSIHGSATRSEEHTSELQSRENL